MNELDQQKALSITDITKKIRTLLEQGVGFVTITGEISNYKLHSSGHRYFSLKDDNAQINAVMWKGKPVGVPLQDGMKVIAKGTISVYPPQGRYQIDCQSIVPVGTGDLFQAYEALRNKLKTLGLFDPEKKKSIPVFPRKIGIATSPTGAAVQDMLTTLKRRNPMADIVLRPTIVQGDAAIQDIVKAIHDLEEEQCDVIIIGRGGGSIEDLWAFNAEEVAYAIFQSSIPIVSGVGHETDFTIADFVADIRAATPTAAAELVTKLTMSDLSDFFMNAELTMRRSVEIQLGKHNDIFARLSTHSGFRRVPEHIRNTAQRIDEFDSRIKQNMAKIVNIHKKSLLSLEAHCMALNPLNPLKKGFALLEKEGKILQSADSIHTGEEVKLIREKDEWMVNIAESLGQGKKI